MEFKRFTSPFDRVDFAHSDAYLSTKKTLLGLLKEVEDYLPTEFYTQPFPPTIFHPAYLIQAVVNGKIKGLVKFPDVLVKEVSRLAFVIHCGDLSAGQQIKKFRDMVRDTGNEKLLSYPQNLRINEGDWEHVQPSAIPPVAKRLAEIGKEQDILFICLGNSAYYAGIDVCLRAQDLVGRQFTDFYPVKFSTQTDRDLYPSLTPVEAGVLRDLAKKRKVVIHDLVVARGKTIDRARMFFTALFDGQKPVTLVHFNNRSQWKFERRNSLRFGTSMEELNKDPFMKDLDVHWIKNYHPFQLVQENFLDQIFPLPPEKARLLTSGIRITKQF